MEWRYRMWMPFLTLIVCAAAGCEPGGHFTILGYTSKPPFDPTIRTVYVPIPKNASWMKNIEFELERAVIAELGMRAGAPRLTSDRNHADTELLMKIVNTTKNEVIINQLGENRNAEISVQIEVVWRDLRPGHVGDILSNKKRFDPERKPLPGDNPDLPPVPVPYLVTPKADYIPELGSSNMTALAALTRNGARQIVNMMEVWK